MKLKRDLSPSLWTNIIFYIYIPILTLLLLIAALSYQTKIPIGVFTRDPAVTVSSQIVIPLIDPNHNPLVGIISQVGILLWCISASLCIFCSIIISNQKYSSKNLADFLRFIGLFTSLLLLDDLFLLHESILPSLLKVPEEFTYCCYGLIFLWGLIRFKKFFIQSNYSILLLSLIFFICSIIADLLPIFSYFGGWQTLLEDGSKLLGIASWLAYYWQFCSNLDFLPSSEVIYFRRAKRTSK